MAKSGEAIATATRTKRSAGPRQPARGRGHIRYDALVDATETLLRTDDPDEVGLYRIAEQANVPPASVYHFFPTKEAAFTAVAMRTMEQLVAVHREPIAAEQVKSWQQLFRIDISRARDFYNNHPAGLKIFYGGYGGVDARNIDQATSVNLAVASYDRMNSLFHMPYLRAPEKKFEARMAILDAIWSLSVRQTGHIDEEYFEESFQACIAYSRTFLPERIELRDALNIAIAEKQTVCLPFDDFFPVDESVSGESTK